jgi:LPXTG-site transpeptidase (sortase) family protein
VVAAFVAAAAITALANRIRGVHDLRELPADSLIPPAVPASKPRGHRAPRGLIAAIAALLCGVALAAPWVVPGFAQATEGLFHDSGSVVVADPAVLASEPLSAQGPASRPPLSPDAVPLRVEVPRLQISSAVVSISSDGGALVPPYDPQQIGWWVEGPHPGSAAGTAVFTGHTVHAGGGAFDHLASLRVGDHFTVQTDHGSFRYVIVQVRAYATGELARQASHVFRLTGPPRVLLVTCTGWNGRIYLENTVVTGAPV